MSPVDTPFCDGPSSGPGSLPSQTASGAQAEEQALLSWVGRHTSPLTLGGGEWMQEHSHRPAPSGLTALKRASFSFVFAFQKSPNSLLPTTNAAKLRPGKAKRQETQGLPLRTPPSQDTKGDPQVAAPYLTPGTKAGLWGGGSMLLEEGVFQSCGGAWPPYQKCPVLALGDCPLIQTSKIPLQDKGGGAGRSHSNCFCSGSSKANTTTFPKREMSGPGAPPKPA